MLQIESFSDYLCQKIVGDQIAIFCIIQGPIVSKSPKYIEDHLSFIVL